MKNNKFDNPYIDNIVGIPIKDPNQKTKVIKFIGEQIENRGSEKIEDFELEKTPRDLEILQFAQDAVSTFMKQDSREKDIQIPINRIHVLSDGETEKFTKGMFRGGSHSSLLASGLVDRNPSDIQFCLMAFHEFLHLKSFQSLQITKPNSKEQNPLLKPYRAGFGVTSRDGEKTYFTDFEEAVIGLLTEEFFNKNIKTSDLFRDELEKRGTSNPPDISRQKETQKFNKLIDELWKKNQDKFNNRDEIKNLFIDAQINGHLLQVGKLIENTFGKGSFREIGSNNS